MRKAENEQARAQQAGWQAQSEADAAVRLREILGELSPWPAHITACEIRIGPTRLLDLIEHGHQMLEQRA